MSQKPEGNLLFLLTLLATVAYEDKNLTILNSLTSPKTQSNESNTFQSNIPEHTTD